VKAAYERILEAALEADQHTFMANKMDSGVRSALKKYGESLKHEGASMSYQPKEGSGRPVQERQRRQPCPS
jgi:deoxyribodipyrimidine photolyase-like uncharacterized protein